MSRKTTPLYEVFPGTDYCGLAYRIVQLCPPALADFLSYEALGSRYDRSDFFKGTRRLHANERRASACRRPTVRSRRRRRNR